MHAYEEQEAQAEKVYDWALAHIDSSRWTSMGPDELLNFIVHAFENATGEDVSLEAGDFLFDMLSTGPDGGVE